MVLTIGELVERLPDLVDYDVTYVECLSCPQALECDPMSDSAARITMTKTMAPRDSIELVIELPGDAQFEIQRKGIEPKKPSKFYS